MVTIVTCADRRGALPGASPDVPARVWRFLAEQSRALTASRLGTTVVVFDHALVKTAKGCTSTSTSTPAAGWLLSTQRPWPAPGGAGLARHRQPAEWVSVVDGYNLLNSGRARARPFHMWVFGAADLYAPIFAHIAATTRLVYAQLDCTFAGAAWRLPRRGPAIASPWPPYDTPTLPELVAGGVLFRLVYEVVDRGAAPRPAKREPPCPRGSPPRAPCAIL
ncbi:US2 protein [Bovine herpesvirus type 1.1 (strain Cooper)]|uniref:Uncharacterized protein US2 n=3 Tax=Bovine herpesvirus 1 TaxID=10320 RepID=Q76PF4_BHV1|nr:US2 protein [Bovine herpesvirus type 1.1]CAB10886.1 hypothetical protein [Bovine alphaherpesvirus 1]